LNPRPLGYETNDTRLLCLASSLVIMLVLVNGRRKSPAARSVSDRSARPAASVHKSVYRTGSPTWADSRCRTSCPAGLASHRHPKDARSWNRAAQPDDTQLRPPAHRPSRKVNNPPDGRQSHWNRTPTMRSPTWRHRQDSLDTDRPALARVRMSASGWAGTWPVVGQDKAAERHGRAICDVSRRQPRQAVTAAAARSMVASAHRAPMICRPTGRPERPGPMGTETAGRPARLAGWASTHQAS
jgi:hypothetical protein